MSVLKQNDSVLNLDEKTAKQIVSVIGRGNLLTSEKEFVTMAVSMGGVFWSDRKKTVVPGKLSDGCVVWPKKIFVERLKNTVVC